jgi:glutamate formiminotransferase/formiminotetrahydrofolate cyclodeaminase
MKKYIHSVPNFSEGRRTEVIAEIIKPFHDTPGVKLIGYYPDADFNRTVVEAIGEPGPLKETLISMTKASIKLIDMNVQTGAHPRIGAQDTIPIFPFKNITVEECKEYIEKLGEEIYRQLRLPVFFTGENARTEERRSLDYIRRGNYEGLKEVVHTDARKPDLGEGKLHEKAGAVILSAGIRPLVPFNIILGTNNLDIAKKIARSVRGPSGGFSTVRAVALKFTERDQVCVSMNMFDYEKTPLYRTYEFVKFEAAKYGVTIVGTELVGTLTQEALVLAAEHYLQLENFDRKQIIDNHLVELN